VFIAEVSGVTLMWRIIVLRILHSGDLPQDVCSDTRLRHVRLYRTSKVDSSYIENSQQRSDDTNGRIREFESKYFGSE
jgi:hypothetical protein